MAAAPPIACKLSAPDLRDRLADLRTRLFSRVVQVDRAGNGGFTFAIKAQDDVVEAALEFIRLERQCCPFLDFTLSLPSQADVFMLGIGGDQTDPALGSFISETFVSLVPEGISIHE